MSTTEQAERELSIFAQQRAADEYAAKHGQTIAKHYIEAGASGMNANRKVFREMLADVFMPGSDIGTIVVYHTSRFTRNATEARVVKEKLRKLGVRVISICQETPNDPMGELIQGIYECIDQYESEVNGLRVSAAMREAIRQGYYPAPRPPYGFRCMKVEVRPGVARSVLIHDEHEAELVRLIFQLYIASSGAKAVARTLNQRRLFYRQGAPWSRDRVLDVLQESAVRGTYVWGKVSARRCKRNDPAEWLELPVKAIVEPALCDLVDQLRKDRDLERAPGHQVETVNLLAKLVRCPKCDANYQLETSTKRSRRRGLYTYRYYNCRTACRVGKEGCIGARIPCARLDEAVLDFIADSICTRPRCENLLVHLTSNSAREERRARKVAQLQGDLEDVRDHMTRWTTVVERDDRHRALGEKSIRELQTQVRHLLRLLEPTAPPADSASSQHLDPQTLQEAWRALVTGGGTVSRNYVQHLIARIEVRENEIRIVPREPFPQ
ncbi:recombinase family protein [Pendulispora rubella]|uniref:Recombinase family protein n=1 Tax=Pendulispora rubella TaxID=2741070 RepID=A0ABZ2L358_9BACT